MASRHRIASIDVLRGLVMIVMALDHVRDFLGAPGNPTNVATASAALFFTRWITHFCAPTFFLLTGTGAYLARRKRSTSELSWFLFTRGAWLIFLELTFLRCFGYQFNVDYRVTMLVILWALGCAMITLALLVHLPSAFVLAFGIALIVGHNAFDAVRPASLGSLAPIWTVLHVPGVVLSTPRFIVFVAYPLVPWVGVTAAGYGLGRIFDWPAERRQAFLVRTGVLSIVAFAVLRLSNVYGDPVAWTHQATATRTALSFLNANKYPPSLLFLLMTLGPAMLFLRLMEARVPRLFSPALTFGHVPMFYFLLHLPLIHVVAVVICYAQYGTAHWMFESPTLDRYPVTFPPGWGFSLPVVYTIWAGIVVALYPACRWFAGVKARRSEPWLSYF